MFKYNGKKILTPLEYESGYRKNHPDKVPVKKVIEKRQASIDRNDYLLMFLVLLAINVMSGGHTIPTVASLYLDWEWWRFIIALAGFIGIEGALFILMARPERGNWAKFSIFVSFIAAILTNVYAVIAHTVTGDLFLGGIGVLLGFIVPVANLAFGNEFHKLAVQRRQEEEAIKLEYNDQLQIAEREFNEAERSFIDRWQQAYRHYLGRAGIKDQVEKDYILSGFAELDAYSGDLNDAPKEQETRKEETAAETGGILDTRSKSAQMREYLKQFPDTTGAELAKLFNVSAALASNVKKKESVTIGT